MGNISPVAMQYWIYGKATVLSTCKPVLFNHWRSKPYWVRYGTYSGIQNSWNQIYNYMKSSIIRQSNIRCEISYLRMAWRRSHVRVVKKPVNRLKLLKQTVKNLHSDENALSNQKRPNNSHAN